MREILFVYCLLTNKNPQREVRKKTCLNDGHQKMRKQRRKRSRGRNEVWGLEKLAEKCKLKQGDTWKKPKRTSNRAGACQTRRVGTHERLRIYLFLDTSSASSSSSTSGQVSHSSTSSVATGGSSPSARVAFGATLFAFDLPLALVRRADEGPVHANGLTQQIAAVQGLHRSLSFLVRLVLDKRVSF